jgi:hypothetical protein
MRVPREVWWIVALTAVAVVLAMLLGIAGHERDEPLPNRTTYSSAPSGLRGLYLTLTELGYQPKRLRRPLVSLHLPERGTLFVVEPMRPPFLSTTEMEDLRAWVAEGNTLVLSGQEVMPATKAKELEGADFPPLFGEPEWTSANPVQPTYLTAGVETLAVRSTYRLALGPANQEDSRVGEHNEEEDKEACFSCAHPTSQLAADLRVAVPVVVDEHGVVVGYARVGRGAVLLLASPWSLSNEGVDEGDNLTFVLNALSTPQSAPVSFDEYHHGYAENIAWGIVPLPAKLGLVQIVLGLLLVAYARSRRLGPVVPLERGGRERSEFLSTMTTVLRKARATRLTVQTAYETTAGRLKVELGVTPEADDEALATAVAKADPAAAHLLRQALADIRWALAADSAPTEAGAAALIRRLDEAAAETRRI